MCGTWGRLDLSDRCWSHATHQPLLMDRSSCFQRSGSAMIAIEVHLPPAIVKVKAMRGSPSGDQPSAGAPLYPPTNREVKNV